MNITKKIEKELLFKNNIREITSISLDTDYKVQGDIISGDFIINGDYKIHEVSINKEKFNFKIPFKETIDKDVNLDSVKLEITNFEYDYRKDELLVNIEYNIEGDRKDILIFDNEESLEEYLNDKQIEVIDTRLEEINKELESLKETDEISKEETKLQEKEIKLETNELTREDLVNKEEIIKGINNKEDKFVTYKIYKIEENDNIEKIIMQYKTSIEDLKEYNDLNNLKINDKLIIPYYE